MNRTNKQLFSAAVWRTSGGGNTRKGLHWDSNWSCVRVMFSSFIPEFINVRWISSELSPYEKSLIIIIINFQCRILSWQLALGIQSIPESSLEYANDNALLVAKVLCESGLYIMRSCFQHKI